MRGAEHDKLRTRTLKYNAAEHCNLRCADCSHLSPYARPRFPSAASLAADLEALSGVLHVEVFGLQGGEPLLNPEIGELARIVRASGIADRVAVFTNGLLLHKTDDSFWRNVDEVCVSLYPESAPPAAVLAAAEQRAAASGTIFDVRPRPHFKTVFVTQPHAVSLMTQLIYHGCLITHRDQCAVLSDGRFYRCAAPLGLDEYLRRLQAGDYSPDGDGVVIHECGDLRRELGRYLCSSRPLDCCRYCLGSAGVRRPHRQMTAQELAQPGAARITPLRHINAYHLARDLVANTRLRMRNALGRGPRL